jgi:branched-chain amino acid transport system ATP-binding protein
VEDNLVLSFKKLLGRRESKEALEAAYIGFPWLRKRRKQIAGTLSGGEQRMLSLAKVFAFSPKLLVADELSFGLAPIVVEEVFQLLERIKLNGITLMIIEQHLDKLLQLADILGLLKKGEIVDYGPLETLKSKLIQL